MMPAEPMTELEYGDFVTKRFAAALAGDPVVFTNRGNTHARAVLSHLISSASSTLDIYTGCLSADIYRWEELRNKVRSLGKGKTRVLIGDPLPFAENSALDYLQSEIEEGFIVPRLGKISVERLLGLNHFALADKISLRVENNHAEKTAVVILNADKVEVPASAGDKKSLAAAYNGLFEQLFQDSVEYSPRQVA